MAKEDLKTAYLDQDSLNLVLEERQFEVGKAYIDKTQAFCIEAVRRNPSILKMDDRILIALDPRKRECQILTCINSHFLDARFPINEHLTSELIEYIHIRTPKNLMG